MADLENMTFDWDSEIEKDSSFILLDPGVYIATVDHFEREHCDATDKLPECEAAQVFFTVSDGKGNETTVKERYRLCRKLEWKLSELFRGTGLKKKGEKLRMNWNALAGCRCRVELTVNKSSQGGEFNNIKRLLDKDEEEEQKLLGTVETDW